MKKILFLNENDTQEIIRSETEKLYEYHVKDAVSDGQLEERELENLEKLKRDLFIPDEVAKSIYQTNARRKLQDVIDSAISDERLSPQEEHEIDEIAKSLGVDLNTTEKTKKALDRYKLLWQIENGELPTLVPTINIQKSEKLHFETTIDWLEQRKVRRSTSYGGASARIKIAKGIYYRVGSISTQSISEDVWQTIDSGRLYLTNKRLIFMGEKGNKTVRLNRILDFQPFKNGIDIQKDTGKSPFLEFDENIELFSMILARLINEL